MKYAIASIVFFWAVVAVNSIAESAEPVRIRIGYPSPSATFYPLFATKEAGLFEKYGFETEMI
jgi:ABC-type nitrate/sulfonate/bicarbonate transport system substrate-binding protein